MTNLIMGPPIFAPLLFGTSAYLGLITSYLQREDAGVPESEGTDHWIRRLLPTRASRNLISAEQDIREGKFQRQVAIVAGVSSLLSGFEAYYSHYKNNFRYKIQWSPVVIAPLLAASAFGSVAKPRLATTALPALSAVAGADAAVGFYITHVACFAVRADGNICSTTLCTARPFLLRCFLVQRPRSACWPAFSDETRGPHEPLRSSGLHAAASR